MPTSLAPAGAHRPRSVAEVPLQRTQDTTPKTVELERLRAALADGRSAEVANDLYDLARRLGWNGAWNAHRAMLEAVVSLCERGTLTSTQQAELGWMIVLARGLEYPDDGIEDRSRPLLPEGRNGYGGLGEPTFLQRAAWVFSKGATVGALVYVNASFLAGMHDPDSGNLATNAVLLGIINGFILLASR
jgi:hypothetical protein